MSNLNVSVSLFINVAAIVVRIPFVGKCNYGNKEGLPQRLQSNFISLVNGGVVASIIIVDVILVPTISN